ncbi:MAG: aldehyde dehydrogenase family protein [Actinobacteria bacterium]|nr:aldehyde dehydrogenase family protein [Actinomycetota bacterium]
MHTPSTGAVAARVAFADADVVDAAVSAASRAFPAWAGASLARRAQVLFLFRGLFARRADEIARVIASEHGKVLSDARGEVARGQEVVEFYTRGKVVTSRRPDPHARGVELGFPVSN